MNTPTMQLMSWADEQGPDIARRLASALAIAQEAYRGRFLRSGDPYITHPIAVALILAERGATPITVITAILHDFDAVNAFIYPGGLEAETALHATFGETIINLLAEFTVLDRFGIPRSPGTIDQRALAINVADRLHNMRTIRYFNLELQRRTAAHTSNLVSPLARQLGLAAIADELDFLAAATLRAHDAPQPTSSTIPGERTVSVRALHGTLRAAVHVLPAHCRARWIQEWEGELCASTDLLGRLRFAADVFRGLPTMAILTRRTSSG